MPANLRASSFALVRTDQDLPPPLAPPNPMCFVLALRNCCCLSLGGAIYDVKENAIILVLDFDFDMGYMFNECTVTDDNILVFDEHVPGEEKDLIYAYDLVGKAWIAHGDELTGRTLNGETRSVVHKDGKDIIIF